jgi:hypothetical protein
MDVHTESGPDGDLAGRGARLLGGGPTAGGAAFAHPDQVLGDERLSRARKREILASWASDARAVADRPALRRLESGAVVRVEEILRALGSLDEAGSPGDEGRGSVLVLRPCFARRDRRAPGLRRDGRVRWGTSEDDDDPPPRPVRAPLPKRGPPPCPAAAAGSAGQNTAARVPERFPARPAAAAA